MVFKNLLCPFGSLLAMADNMDPVEKKRRQTDDSMEKMLARLTQSFTQIMDKTLAKQAEENEQMMERMKEENKTIAEKHALGWREDSIALVHRVAEGFNLKVAGERRPHTGVA